MPDQVAPPKALPASKPVKMRPDLAAFLADLAEHPRKIGAPERPWTPEEDAFLLAARAGGAYWEEIAERLGCNETTARKRWRKLTAKK